MVMFFALLYPDHSVHSFIKICSPCFFFPRERDFPSSDFQAVNSDLACPLVLFQFSVSGTHNDIIPYDLGVFFFFSLKTLLFTCISYFGIHPKNILLHTHFSSLFSFSNRQSWMQKTTFRCLLKNMFYHIGLINILALRVEGTKINTIWECFECSSWAQDGLNEWWCMSALGTQHTSTVGLQKKKQLINQASRVQREMMYFTCNK